MLWVTVLVSVPVLAWMGFFLLIWPQLMRQSGMMEQYQHPDKALIQTKNG